MKIKQDFIIYHDNFFFLFILKSDFKKYNTNIFFIFDKHIFKIFLIIWKQYKIFSFFSFFVPINFIDAPQAEIYKISL